MESDNTHARIQAPPFSLSLQTASVDSGVISEQAETVASGSTEIGSEPANQNDKNEEFAKPTAVEAFDEKQDESESEYLCKLFSLLRYNFDI